MVSPEQVMAAEWSTLVLAYILVGLRVAVRVTLKQKHLLISDLWLLLAALCVLGLVVCDTITYRMGAMSDFDITNEQLDKACIANQPDQERHADTRQVRFATNYLFDAGLYLPKLSMLALYFQLFPRHDSLLRWSLYFVTAFTASSALVTTISDTFWCGPDPSVNWSTDRNACSTFMSDTLMRINWSLCIACEILIFFLPFPLLSQLRTLTGRERAGLALVFTLGVVTLIVSSGRFITMMKTGNDISIYIWANTEFTVSIIVVACIALRPLVNKVWGVASFKRDTSQSKTRSYGLSHTASVMSRAVKRILQHHDAEALADDRDPTASEIELNSLQQGEIVKTTCIGISGGLHFKDGSFVSEDEACGSWRESPREGLPDAV